MAERSVGIAGAGIVGLSIAWRLAQRGFKVTVFDAGRAASEASWAGAGMLAPGGEVDHESELARAVVQARLLYSSFIGELAAESGCEVDYQQNGGLDLAYSTEELFALLLRREEQTALGIASKVMEAGSIATFWPHVRRDGLDGGVFYPNDAIVDPREVTRALLAACRGRGVIVREGTAVVRLIVQEGHVAAHWADGYVLFDNFVVAAGAWSNAISIEGALPLPSVRPVKGVLLGYRQPAQTCNTIVRRGHTYFLQRANGLMIVGASVEHVGFERKIKDAVVQDLAAKAAAVFPHLGETTPTEVWTGFRPYAEDLHVGRWQESPILLAYGHFRNGILLAPHTADRIAAEM